MWVASRSCHCLEPSVPTPSANLLSSLQLLEALLLMGLERLVICPGSRSGPLAVAAGILEQRTNLQLFTSIDERSAAFFALGAARASGKGVAVLTTSGTAVANLLPALIEAEKSAIPILILTADRPSYLKNCGSNQTVAQERFLMNGCKWLGHGSSGGLATMNSQTLTLLAKRAWAEAHGIPSGPVHLNLPLDEPLHINELDLRKLLVSHTISRSIKPKTLYTINSRSLESKQFGKVPYLCPDKPSVIVVGPWRGAKSAYHAFVKSIVRLQNRTGWPILADPLSSLRGYSELNLITTYDLFLQKVPSGTGIKQVLRLGPMPASRHLQRWIENATGSQILITEEDPRPQDFLHVAQQWSGGLNAWCNLLPNQFWTGVPNYMSLNMASSWHTIEERSQNLLNQNLSMLPIMHEPLLARELEKLIPNNWAIMLANSSPVRDWENFTQSITSHTVEGFRGSSGIDGTLSLAMGLASVYKRLFLITGDLALLHDSNGWLWQQQISKVRSQLTVLVIDNSGGGIFEQLNIRSNQNNPSDLLSIDFEKLFTMPQTVDHRILAASHGISSRVITCLEDLNSGLEWAQARPLALLYVATNRFYDSQLRQQLRNKIVSTNEIIIQQLS
uniref:Menaquinone biosynthesis protein n=1 Tax=Paulinella longichromatophora TaxID=1708747 RepID=A0A2H4ZQM9_9EUKA|nr:Menaquinone biosynthesis protein [Paulinella longichromatophora]